MFISLQNTADSVGNVTILGATIADNNTYTYTMTAAVDAQVISANFSV